jgi:hypothetical protein
VAGKEYLVPEVNHGGLSTPGACSKVTHLHRQHLLAYTASIDESLSLAVFS